MLLVLSKVDFKCISEATTKGKPGMRCWCSYLPILIHVLFPQRLGIQLMIWAAAFCGFHVKT